MAQFIIVHIFYDKIMLLLLYGRHIAYFKIRLKIVQQILQNKYIFFI